MEIQSPRELTDILSKLGQEYKESRDVRQNSEELYFSSKSILEEYDIMSPENEDPDIRKILRKTRLIPIPESNYAIGLHNHIPMIYRYSGIKVGLFGLDDNDNRVLISNLYKLYDGSIGEKYKMFFTYGPNGGIIKTVEELKPVRVILDFIRTNLEVGNVE